MCLLHKLKFVAKMSQVSACVFCHLSVCTGGALYTVWVHLWGHAGESERLHSTSGRHFKHNTIEEQI